MYTKIKDKKSQIKRNESYQGETIEAKVRRIMSNKEPITDGAPLIYTERKDGVQPDYDIRTDRFEYGIDVMDKIAKSEITKRQQRWKKTDIGGEAQEGMKKEGGEGTSVNTRESN